MRIAILYVALGRYDLFWPEFISSCRNHFCPNSERHWYVFTDSSAIAPAADVSVLHQDFLGWPFSTLYRYHLFRRISDEIAGFDYVVFFNANASSWARSDLTNSLVSIHGFISSPVATLAVINLLVLSTRLRVVPVLVPM